MSEIILITDLIDIRSRKIKELEYYNRQMEELRLKMVFIQQEIKVTSTIISMIEKETIIDIGLHIKKVT
jgi:hypothetical protein